MKGDRVEIVIDAGGTVRTYEVSATRAGRRVETTHGRGIVEVAEVTRGGTPVGVRLVSIISDDLQHAGQAAFVRGVLERRLRVGGPS